MNGIILVTLAATLLAVVTANPFIFAPGRFYTGNYGYVAGGPGAGGIPGLAQVRAAQNFESYNYGVKESGPHYQKYHHQTGAFHPVPGDVIAPPVPVVPAVPAVPAVPVVAV